jgi:hypothetical protein
LNQLNEKYNDLEKQIQEKQAQFDSQFEENKKLQSDLVILIFKFYFANLIINIISIAI